MDETSEMSNPDEKKISLANIFLAFLKMGLTAFGPAMMVEAKKNIVNRQKWMSEQEFLNGLALAQFLPGATLVTLTVFMGYRIRRLAGAFASFLGFLLPSTVLMVILSYLYFRYSELPMVHNVLTGLEAVVVALIANAVLDIGKSVLKDRKTIVIAVIALGVASLNTNIFLILLLAAILSIILYRPWATIQDRSSDSMRQTFKFNIREIIIVFSVTTAIALLSALNPLLLKLESVFFEIGLLVFGNGFTMIPLIQQQVVNVYHWLNLSQFTVGIALGQVTPGPVVITATFVGYKVAGLLGATAATIGIFAPCFILVLLVMPVYTQIKENPWVKVIFMGVLASFVGLMIVVMWGMARHSLTNMVTIAVALAAFLALRLTKLDVLWVVLGGTGLYLLIGVIPASLPPPAK
ncbi:MAG: chromate efflux transporter [Desulfitobacteriaceae bacterium]